LTHKVIHVPVVYGESFNICLKGINKIENEEVQTRISLSVQLPGIRDSGMWMVIHQNDN